MTTATLLLRFGGWWLVLASTIAAFRLLDGYGRVTWRARWAVLGAWLLGATAAHLCGGLPALVGAALAALLVTTVLIAGLAPAAGGSGGPVPVHAGAADLDAPAIGEGSLETPAAASGSAEGAADPAPQRGTYVPRYGVPPTR